MSDNPFQAPSNIQPTIPGKTGPEGSGYVRQVPVVAALMIAQGVLLALFGCLMVFYIFVFSTPALMGPAANDPQFARMMQTQGYIFILVFGGYAAGSLILAILHFASAYFAFNYQRRILIISTLISGLLSVFTCYCSLTAIALAVYGLIIFFNPTVARAFALRASGMSKEKVLQNV